MKLVTKVLIGIIVLLLAVMAGGIWWVQHYVQSPKFIEKIQQNMSDSLGTQVHLGKLSFNIFYGCTLSGVEIENPPPDNASRLFKIDSVHIQYTPLALLNKQLVIREFDLNRPEISIKFYPDGNSNLPQVKKRDDSPGVNLAASDKVHLAVSLDQFKLQNGKFVVLNADQETTFLMDNVQLKGTYELAQTGAKARGNVEIERMLLGSKFKVTGASSSINFQNEKLELPDLKGNAYGGALTGFIQSNFSPGANSFSLNLKLDKGDAFALVKDFGGNLEWMQGKLNLVTQLEGSLLQPKLLSGKGDFEIADTGLAKFGLLSQIAQIFSLSEITESQFKQIKGSFKIGDQKITFYNIEALADKVQISTSGSVTFDGVGDFDVLFAVNESLVSKIPEAVAKQLTKRDDNFRTIIFHLSGPVSEMKTNLPEKLGEAAVNSIVDKLKERLFKKPEPEPVLPAKPVAP